MPSYANDSDEVDDPLAYLAPIATALSSRGSSGGAPQPIGVIDQYLSYAAAQRSQPAPRPMEPVHRSGMLRHARRRLEAGRLRSPADVEKDIDWHSERYDYENPATKAGKQQLAAQLYGEHEQRELEKRMKDQQGR